LCRYACVDASNLNSVYAQSCDSPRRSRLLRLFLEADGPAVAIELDDAVPLGIADPVCEHGAARGAPHGAAQIVGQAVAVEDVVAEREGDRIPADELSADEERLGQAIGARLHGVI